MPPAIATGICVLGVLGLFWFDWDRQARTSKALLVPVVWLSLAGSRAVSQWMSAFGFGDAGPRPDSPDQLLDGSPIDRNVFAVLLILGLAVLFKRRRQIGQMLRANLPIVLFLLYCALSIFWSDQPGVAFKRWTKAAGDLVMVLIVVSEFDPSAAVKRLLAWASFLLIPFSVLLIKYYPNLGLEYNRWTWAPLYAGVTTNKNTLGMICMLFGLGAVWRLISAYRNRKLEHRKQQMIAHGVILAMVLWLFGIANSMTSLSCFLLAGALIIMTSFFSLARRPAAVHALVASVVVLSVFVLFFDPAGYLLRELGRNSTLTGRTEIWEQVLPMAGNPLFGTGYESFWLGKRLEKMWTYNRDIHQAHNGYLEIYLNLGWIGLALLTAVLVTGYRRVISAIRRKQEFASLWLAFFVVAIVYNLTEAAFGMMSPVWIFLLLVITSLPRTVAATSKVRGYPELARPMIPLSQDYRSTIHCVPEDLQPDCAAVFEFGKHIHTNEAANTQCASFADGLAPDGDQT